MIAMTTDAILIYSAIVSFSIQWQLKKSWYNFWKIFFVDLNVIIGVVFAQAHILFMHSILHSRSAAKEKSKRIFANSIIPSIYTHTHTNKYTHDFLKLFPAHLTCLLCFTCSFLSSIKIYHCLMRLLYNRITLLYMEWPQLCLCLCQFE